MARLRGDPTAATKSSRKSLAMRRFRAEVRAQALPVDRDAMRQLRARCQRHGHALIGPLLQYRENTPDRGRYYALCKHDHPGESRPQPVFEHVSGRLLHRARSQLESRRIALYLQLVGTLPSQPRQRTSSQSRPATRERAQRTRSVRALTHTHEQSRGSASGARSARARYPIVLVDSFETAFPSLHRPRSLISDDVVASAVVPVPEGYRGSLRVQFFINDGQPPVFFTLRGGADTMYYLLGAYSLQWNAADVKNSDRVKILTYADEDMQIWQPATLGDIAIPAFCGGVVLAHVRVVNFHDSLNAYLTWCCNEPVVDASSNSEVPPDGKWVY